MVSLLQKGLTFIPDKQKENISDIISEVDQWGRRLKLKAHFADRPSINADDSRS